MNITLRIIQDRPCSAAFNMAADLYLLSVCFSRPCIYVRFYRWEPPAITLGYMQRAEEILDFEIMEKDGIQWIHRPTGGRAVLHFNDLTYSCVFPKQVSKMGTDIAETYHLISGCLIRGLELSGISCATHNSLLDTRGIRGETKLPCFLAPNRNEIMVDSRKLIGSAQKRTADTVLQHGSIPLSDDFRKLPNYQKINERERSAYTRLLKDKCTCIDECLENYKDEHLIQNLIQGFGDTLDFEIELQNWTEKELQIINNSRQEFKVEC